MSVQFPILLADDEPTMADILNRAASSAFPEAKFIVVCSVEEAVRYLDGLEGRDPQLVILDINLRTELNGLDFLTIWRQHPQGRLVPVIILSSDESRVNKQEAYDRGANAFILKPDSYTGWKKFIEDLRTYWFEVVSLPKLWFEKEAEENV